MKTIELPEFIDFLSAQTAEDFRGTAVDNYLQNHTLGLDTFLPFIYFREDTYARNLVYKTDLFEMILLTWLPKHRTPIHDHAGQRCWMVVQSGKLSFRNYAPVADDLTQSKSSKIDLVCDGSLQTIEEGHRVYIDDGIGIHSISNCDSKPAISMHLYAGPISRCRRYDEATKQFNWVDLCYFTKYGELEKAPAPETKAKSKSRPAPRGNSARSD